MYVEPKMQLKIKNAKIKLNYEKKPKLEIKTKWATENAN